MDAELGIGLRPKYDPNTRRVKNPEVARQSRLLTIRSRRRNDPHKNCTTLDRLCDECRHGYLTDPRPA